MDAMTDRAAWTPATGLDPKSLVEARTQAHNVTQWLARLANSYLPPEAEQRHLWLSYDAARQALVTRPFAGDVTVELRLPALELQFREGGRPVPHILAVEGHSPAKVEAWVLVELLHRGIDRDRFSKSLPYTPSNLLTGDNTDYAPEACARQLGELAQWLNLADRVLGGVAEKLGPAEGGAGRLLCWPEQLHAGLLAGVTPGEAAHGRALRIAVSAGDERIPEPYFFVAVQTGGEVETPHPGAILAASRIVAEDMRPDQIAAALDAAVATTRRRLAN